MLISFTVGNYRSFKDKVTLSMEATAITEHPDNVYITPDGRYKLLKSVAIYGANGSGKSNLIMALQSMLELIVENSKFSSVSTFSVDVFQLSKKTQKSPSFFEICFLRDNVKYRYGFEVDESSICAEWLFETKIEKERPLFKRVKDTIDRSSVFKEGKNLEQKTGENRLFLSVVDQNNGAISKIVMTFLGTLIAISALKHREVATVSMKLLTNQTTVKSFKKFLNEFNLGFSDIEATNTVNDKFELHTQHKIFDSLKRVSGLHTFNNIESESKGTNKIIDLSGLLYIAINSSNKILCLDELDASLHPKLTIAITKLFNAKNNISPTQLIFTTHDTNLLSKGGFRRDQIYFVEKDQYETTHLYSLVEFKVRKDRSFEEDYIQGRYGAIPFIGDFTKLAGNGK
jgi:uncharacterized protein